MLNWLKSMITILCIGKTIDTQAILDRLEAPNYHDTRLSASVRTTLFKSWTEDMQFMIETLMNGGSAVYTSMAKSILKHLKMETSCAKVYLYLEPNIKTLMLEDALYPDDDVTGREWLKRVGVDLDAIEGRNR